MIEETYATMAMWSTAIELGESAHTVDALGNAVYLPLEAMSSIDLARMVVLILHRPPLDVPSTTARHMLRDLLNVKTAEAFL
jgi:hypothetical protein